ncbi:hypothetical protein SAMN04490243_2103 [Robiginitalea myxolifaciens]|uniref:Glycosyl transferase family 2 n=1 Tax=Robiginitalea myxolifaciens TaxID=400055 RepID=A0A1I6H2C0_9FLAO|nr:hypothetical protein [Robiginitalea myxolifaciens]SFR48477.1 hypothetical protein SAMN04490243_2103 [Robiginitalea myxolifaciens]
MLVFIVPIKSEQVSTNWKVFSVLVDRTLRSICNQTSEDFRVIAVCHEIPPVDFTHDKLEFLQVDFDPPTDDMIARTTPQEADPKHYRNAAKEADKARKIKAGMERSKAYDPDYIMVVDADDCIHNGLAQFASDAKDKPAGWFIKKGYIYNEGSNLIFLNKNTFNVLCGTCLIVRADLAPQLVNEKGELPVFSHEWEALPTGESLKPLPFAGAIYSIGNTENYCSTPEAVKKMNSYPIFSKSFVENVVRKMAKYRLKLVTPGFRERFGLERLELEAAVAQTQEA